ncbi:hypothetical protein Aperf_G00000129294 [Anoplocephala perfoliata]
MIESHSGTQTHHRKKKRKNHSDKLKYDRYWNESLITSGISSGRVISGQIRVNPRKYTDAYIKHPKGDADILIPGTRARNRSLNGDLVYLKLEPLMNWKIYDAFLSNKVKEWASVHHQPSSSKSCFVTVGEFLLHDSKGFEELFKDYTKVIKKNLNSFNDLPEQQDLPMSADLSWWQIIQRVGSVVAIHRKLNCRIGMGYLRPQMFIKKGNQQAQDHDTSLATTDWHCALFSPTDSRLPRIMIPKKSCPEDFVRQPETFKLVRFVARITAWPEDSFYAKGQLVRKFGEESTSFINCETERILVNAGFAYGLDECMCFPDNVESYVNKKILPSMTKASFKKELSYRRDYRSQCVFTIDPRTARDLDDALHIRRLSKDETTFEAAHGFTDVAYEVGVHIADVSYYVRPEDPVDVEAASRATSIYLIQLCVPMLPRELCENLCSLHPGSDKLTFSVVFRLNSNGQILSRWLGRTVINSRAKLSYEDAQAFIDDPDRDWQASDLPNLQNGVDIKEICRCVNMLNELAVKMRTRRFENGALQLNQVKPTFTLSEETGLPIGVAPFIIRPANHLVEEWMLAANEAVAAVLATHLPKTAFLRRHPPPTGKQLRDARALLQCCNVDVDITSAHSIQDSLNRISSCPAGTIWQHSDELAELCASMMACSLDSEAVSNSNITPSVTDEERSRRLDKEAHLLATLNVLVKCMNLAEYFCLGETLEREGDAAIQCHYALNATHYTHFTSPIRRYADLIVHRQLAQILTNKAEAQNQKKVASFYRATSTSRVLHKPDQLAAIAEVCNARKLDSRKASEDSVELFFTIFVKECGPLIEACSIVSILDRAFDVLILTTGFVRRIYLDDLDLSAFEFEELKGNASMNVVGMGVLHLQWNVHPVKPTSTTSEEEASNLSTGPVSHLLMTDPAVMSLTEDSGVTPESCGSKTVTPPCDCFRQDLHLFDLVRCAVSVKCLGEVERNEVAACDSRVGESNTNLENSTPKASGDGNDQVLKLRLTLLRPTCDICKDYPF